MSDIDHLISSVDWQIRAEAAEAERDELQLIADNRLRELECLRAPFVETLPGDEDGYEPPKDGWVCFHCGIRFKTIKAASAHFGASPTGRVACVDALARCKRLEGTLREAVEYGDTAIAEYDAAGLGVPEEMRLLIDKVRALSDTAQPVGPLKIQTGHLSFDNGQNQPPIHPETGEADE